MWSVDSGFRFEKTSARFVSGLLQKGQEVIAGEPDGTGKRNRQAWFWHWQIWYWCWFGMVFVSSFGFECCDYTVRSGETGNQAARAQGSEIRRLWKGFWIKPNVSCWCKMELD